MPARQLDQDLIDHACSQLCRSNVTPPPEPLDALLDAGRIASQHAAAEQQRLIENYLAALEEFYEPPEGVRR